MSKEAIEALKYVRLDPSSGIKTSILHQLAVLHRIDKGYAYPGIDFLARRCGIGRSSLRKHLSELERASPKAIIRSKNKGGRGRTNHYVLPWERIFVNYMRSLGKPPPETTIQWESTARRQARLQKERSEHSDGLEDQNSPNTESIPSEHSSNTVRRLRPKKKSNTNNSSPRKIERSSNGPTAIGELLTRFRQIDPGEIS